MKTKAFKTEYPNYRPTELGPVEEVANPTPEQLFEQYVVPRKPVKITADLPQGFEWSRLALDHIVDTLGYDEKLQVEEKHALGFGGGHQRVRMTLAELVDKLKQGLDQYYLTTQYEKESDDEGGAEVDDLMKQLADEEEDEDDGEEGNVAALMKQLAKDVEEGDEGDEDDVDEDDNEEKENDDDEDDDDDDDDDDEVDEHNQAAIAELMKKLEQDVQEDEDEADSDGLVEGESRVFEGFSDGVKDEDDDDDEVDEVEDDEDDQEVDDEARISELLQAPLTPLVANPEFAIEHPYFPTLIPQQINLWMGQGPAPDKPAPEFPTVDESLADGGLGRYIPPATIDGELVTGTSSGLHHDHSDNLYILIEGVKRFTMYSPAFAHALATVGTIYRIFHTGVIDYLPDAAAPNWKHIREDGAMVDEIKRWQGHADPDSDDDTAGGPGAGHPPSFLKIPPVLLHLDDLTPDQRRQLVKFATAKFPELLALPRLTAWLRPGEMLYLPTGWFHEVSSFKSPHIAVNYWFIPPANSAFADPYNLDGYWQHEWQQTKASISRSRL